jgi:hypothetical protein
MLTDASFDTGGLWWKICAGREPLLLQGGAGLQSSGKAVHSSGMGFRIYQGTTLVVP